MLFIVFLFVELIALYFLSRRLINLIYNLFLRVTQSSKLAAYLLAFIFFPGTFIHEMSHALAALFLLVPFGEVRLLPVMEKNGVKMGSVGIAKSDPIRRFLIGVAPFIIGTFGILMAIYLVAINPPAGEASRFIETKVWGKLFAGYIIFEVGNMMFASSKDLEGAYKLVIFIAALFVIGAVLGVRLPLLNFDILNSDIFLTIGKRVVIYLFIPLIIDSVLIFLLSLVYNRA